MKQSATTASTFSAVSFLLLAAIGVGTSCARLSRRADSAETQSSPVPDGSEIPGTGKLNLNTASASELEKLPGVGRVLAERIISHRKQYGPFRRIEHLIMVRGISDRKFREIRLLLTIE
jgi:competence protein ComEA